MPVDILHFGRDEKKTKRILTQTSVVLCVCNILLWIRYILRGSDASKNRFVVHSFELRFKSLFQIVPKTIFAPVHRITYLFVDVTNKISFRLFLFLYIKNGIGRFFTGQEFRYTIVSNGRSGDSFSFFEFPSHTHFSRIIVSVVYSAFNSLI